MWFGMVCVRAREAACLAEAKVSLIDAQYDFTMGWLCMCLRLCQSMYDWRGRRWTPVLQDFSFPECISLAVWQRLVGPSFTSHPNPHAPSPWTLTHSHSKAAGPRASHMRTPAITEPAKSHISFSPTIPRTLTPTAHRACHCCAPLPRATCRGWCQALQRTQQACTLLLRSSCPTLHR